MNSDRQETETIRSSSHRVWEDAVALADQNPDYVPSALKRTLLMFAAFGVLAVGLVLSPLFVVGKVVEEATYGRYGELLQAPTELGIILFFVLGLLALMGERNAMRHGHGRYGETTNREASEVNDNE